MKINLRINQSHEKTHFFLTLFGCLITCIWYDISTDAMFDPGDGVHHLLIARNSWSHPLLFLNMWGKPFFTLISSPFAQFGMNGMIFFQGLLTALSSYLCYLIAKKLQLSYAWILPLFIFLSPLYFNVINTGLTEICFSGFFILSVWLLFEEKWVYAAVVASLLPFIRPEAYIAIPLIAIVLLLKKKLAAIPFLVTGALVYSILCYLFLDDFWGLITDNYVLTKEGYVGQKGPFLHFIQHYKEITGTAFALLILLGTGISVYFVLSARKISFLNASFKWEYFFLIQGGFLGFLFLHAFLYWMPGIFTNLGMLRYMAVLIPSASLIALTGLNALSKISPKRDAIFVLGLPLLVVYDTFTQEHLPFRKNAEQVIMNEAGNFIRSGPYKDKFICFQHLYLPYCMNLDPYDPEKTLLFWSLNKESGFNSLPDSLITVWDSHYSTYEGEVPLDRILNDSHFILLKSYKYYLASQAFETLVFLRTKTPPTVVNSIPEPEIITDLGPMENFEEFFTETYDFDTLFPENRSKVVFNKPYSGRGSIKVDEGDVYSTTIYKPLDLFGDNKIALVKVDYRILPLEPLKDLSSVMEMRNWKQRKAAYLEPLNNDLKLNEWNAVEMKHIFFPSEAKNKFTFRFYFWNNGRNKFYLDDITLHYYRLKIPKHE